MPGRYHTVIVVPHTRAKLRKLRISTTQLRLAVAAVGILTVVALFVSWSFFHTSVDRQELDRLRAENEDLRDVNHSFEESINRLQQQLASYEDRTRQLAIAAGLDAVSSGSGAGIGGDNAPVYDSYDQFLGALETRADQVAGQLDEVGQQLEDRQRWIASMPAIAPVRGILTSGFGHRRDPITRKPSFHPAIDISAPAGHAVRAPADGVVLRTGRIGGLGNAIYVGHGFGVTTRFGHLSKIEVKPGDTVQRGDVIGAVGNTGRSTGYHLHYEVRVDGKATNPLAYILDAPRRR